MGFGPSIVQCRICNTMPGPAMEILDKVCLILVRHKVIRQKCDVWSMKKYCVNCTVALFRVLARCILCAAVVRKVLSGQPEVP